MSYIPELFINYYNENGNIFTSIYGFDEILLNNTGLIDLAEYFTSEFNVASFTIPSSKHIRFNKLMTSLEIKKLFCSQNEIYNTKLENFTFDVSSNMSDPTNEFSWRTYINNTEELLKILNLNSIEDISLNIDFNIYKTSSK